MAKRGCPEEIDISKNEYKVGDRVFFEIVDYNTETGKFECVGIGTNIITGIRKESYEDDTTRADYFDTGTIVHYNMFETWGNSLIEDYNCLSNDDPRVVEYCQGRTLCGPELKNKIREFLTEHGAMPGDAVVADMLYDLMKEYGG